MQPSELLTKQPIQRITRDGTEYVILGTAHVSKTSVDAVIELVNAETFDAIAVELCQPRVDAIHNPDLIADMDLFRVLREGRATAVAAGLALGAYQRRLAKQFGIEPGAEMKAAMQEAKTRHIPCWLIDREVSITLRRTRAAVGFWERTKMSAGIVASLLDDSPVEEQDIERLKQGDILESTFTEFAKQSPPLYQALIAERDQYMAARLRECASTDKPTKVLVVIGAGHLGGIATCLTQESREPTEILPPLKAEPPPSSFGKWFGISLIGLVLFGFAWAFSRGTHVGIEVVQAWILSTGIFGALGALAAGANPLSIIAAFIASPLTPLHPALASGMVSGAVETWTRKPRVSDFQSLREDLNSMRGWWRNRVSRVFLVFMLTNLGTSLGVWVATTQAIAILAQ